MDILKIAMIGMAGVCLAIPLKSYKAEYGMLISLGTCVCIFIYLVTKLEIVVEYIGRIETVLNLDGGYIRLMLKMMGITYVAQFAAEICKDAGYGAVGSQIELFGKVSILFVSIAGIAADGWEFFMRDRDVLRSCDFGCYIGKLKVNLFFIGILLLLCMVIFPLQVQAEKKEADTDLDRELDTGLEKEADSDVDFDTERKEMLGYLTKENLFSDLDEFSGRETGMTFSELVGSISKQGALESLAGIGGYIKEALVGELEENKKSMMQIVVLVLIFSILQNFLGLVENSYITELCYVLTYLVLMLFVLKSFSVTSEIVSHLLQNVTGFMKMLLPSYLAIMVFAGNAMSAMSFYELTFFILYGIEVLMIYVLLPLINLYVLFYLTNCMMKEEVFSKTAELVRDIFSWGAKLVLTIVVGLNVVQGMIAPAVDYASRTTLTKSLSLIPGIGGAAAAIGDIFIGSGMVIKNSVGVAAMVLLIFLSLIPFCKVLIITLLYKCMAAFLEPIADKRIAGAMSGAAHGGEMLMRVITTTVFMVFITVAMMCATTSFVV